MLCLSRCVSVRSSLRVITHLLAVPPKSKTTGDTQQLFARGLGLSSEVDAVYLELIKKGTAHVSACT